MDFASRFEMWKAQAEEAIKAALAEEGIPQTLRSAMRYSVDAGGKRLRPVLVYAGADLAGAADNVLLGPFAAAMEMIHTYSLIHDDLPAMDNDDLRRGRPTSHVVFGEAMAILAGDGLLSQAFETMLCASENAPAHMRSNAVRAMRIIARGAGASGMVAGQSLDLLSEGEMDMATLHEIHRCKTGAMIAAAVTAGAVLGGLDGEALACVRRYGESIGLVFQIADDILDATSTPEQMGKSVGKDEREKKLTFVRLFGLEEAQKRAEIHTQIAVDALAPLGERAAFLLSLARFLLERKA